LSRKALGASRPSRLTPRRRTAAVAISAVAGGVKRLVVSGSQAMPRQGLPSRRGLSQSVMWARILAGDAHDRTVDWGNRGKGERSVACGGGLALPKGHGGAHGWPPADQGDRSRHRPVVAATSALVPLSAVGAASGTTNAIPPVPVVTLPPEPVVTLPAGARGDPAAGARGDPAAGPIVTPPSLGQVPPKKPEPPESPPEQESVAEPTLGA